MAAEVDLYSYLNGPDEAAQPKDPTWEDYGRAAGAGAAEQLGAGTAANVRAATDRAPTAVGRFSNELSKTLQQGFNETADNLRGGMSEVAQKRIATAVTSEEFLKQPGSIAALKAAGFVPSMAALVFSGGPVGAAIAGGILSSGEFNNTVDKLIDKHDDAALRDTNPWYANLRDAGMSEAEARIDLKEKISGNRALVNFLTGTATGALGAGGKLASAAAGKAAATFAGEGASATRRAVVGGLEGGISEGIEEGTQAVTGQLAETDFNPKKQFDTRQIVDSVAEGVLFGGAFGAAAHAATGGHSKKASSKVEATEAASPPVVADAPHIAPAENTSVGNEQNAPTRSETVYQKAEAAKRGKGSKASVQTKVVVAEPGAAPAPDQAMALAEINQTVAPKIAPVIPEPVMADPVAPEPAVPEQAPVMVPAEPVPAAQARAAGPAVDVQPALAVAEPGAPPQLDLAPVPQQESPLPQQVEIVPSPAKTGRILKATTAEAKAKEAEIEQQVKEQAKKIRENIKLVEQPAPDAPKGKNWTIKEREERAKAADNAKVVFDKHVPEQDVFPTTPEQRAALQTRLGAMVKEAEELGVKIPTKVGYAGTADHVVYLRAAKDLAKKLGQKSFTGARAREQIEGFLIAERAARTGDFSVLRDTRKVEGDIARRRDQGDVEAKAAHSGDGAEAEAEAVQTKIPKSARGAVRDSRSEERAPSEVRKVEVTDDVKAKALAALEVARRRQAEKDAAAADIGAKPEVTPKVTEKPKAPAMVRRDFDRQVKEQVETKPTDAQKEAGNYAKAHLKIDGLDITIENPRGTKREGTAPNGKKWSVRMPDHYGYIKRTEGADGDHVDVYLGPKAYPGSQVLGETHVYVVHQKDLNTGKFDEHKVMLGYDSQSKAEIAYDNGFSDGRGRKRIQKVDVMTLDEFKAWVKSAGPKENTPAETAANNAAELARVAKDYVIAKIDEPQARAEIEKLGVDDAAWKAAVQKAMLEEYQVAPLGRRRLTSKADGKPVDHEQVMSATKLLEHIPTDHLTGTPKALANFMRARLRMLAGDTPVYVYSKENFARLVGDDSVLLENDADGFVGFHKLNDDGTQTVALRDDVFGHRGKAVRAVLHELTHAATHRALFEDKRFHNDIRSLMGEVNEVLPEFSKEEMGASSYAMSHPVEFIAEAFSNPDFQRVLESVVISDQLAAQLNMPTRRISSAWDALIGFVRRALVKIFGDSDPGFTALDAIIRIGEGVERARLRELADAEKTGARRPIRHEDFHEGAFEARLNAPILQGAAGTNIAGRIRRAKDKLSSFKQLAERTGAIFGEEKPIEQMFRERARMEHEKDRILETNGSAEFIRDVAAYERKHGPEAARTLADVAFDASNFNVDPTAGADNSHLGVDATRGWQAKKMLPSLQARYAELPEDGRALLARGAALFKRTHNDVSLQNIKNILEVADINEPGLAERIHRDGLTEADRERFKENNIVKALNEAHEIKEMKGWYFPFRRYGQFTSTGYTEFATPQGATRISDDTVQFHAQGDTAARRAARAFVESQQDLRHLDTKKVWVDASDPTKVLEKEDVNAVPAYRVTLQTKHVEFHDTEAQAVGAADEYSRQGLARAHTGRLDENDQRMSVDVSNRLGQLLTALEKQQRFKNMDSNEQAALRQSLRETMISAMGSTHLRSVYHQRRNVAGMSRDLGRVAADYSRMSANYLAKLLYQPKIDALFSQVSEYAKAHKYDGNSLRRDELIKTLKERVYGSNADDHLAGGFVNDATRRLLQVTRLARLAGVSFHVINSQEPWTTSLPVIGGRHGFGRTSKALVEAYNTIGARGGVIAGFRDTAKAFGADNGFTDYVAMFKRNIQNSPMLGGSRAERLVEALEYGERLNLYGNDTKFEVGKYADPAGNVVGRAFDRADLMANQVGSAIEGINRAVTTLAAYELEYKKNGGNHEAAMEYAYNVAHTTMGDYSAWNTAPVFNTKFGRLALQFKKFGHKMYYLLGKTLQGTLARDPEATKQFVGLMVTHAMVAGALGLPIEPFKVALLAANAAGLTGFSDDDFENAVRRLAADVLGSKGGEIFAHGLPRALGIDTSSRQGLDSLMTFGAPKSNKQADVKSWLFDTMAGAPVGYLMDQVAAAQALMKGDVTTALEKSVPIRAVTDVVKAVDGISGPKLNDDGRERRPAMTPYQAAVRAVGFTPSTVTENYKKNIAFAKASKAQQKQRSDFMAAWVQASSGERLRLWGRIEQYNRTVPAEVKITRNALDSYAKRRGKEHEEKVNGLRAAKSTRHIAKELDYYNSN